MFGGFMANYEKIKVPQGEKIKIGSGGKLSVPQGPHEVQPLQMIRFLLYLLYVLWGIPNAEQLHVE
jgi:hypothetical protein